MSNAVTLAQSCLCPSIPAPGSKFSATFTSPSPMFPPHRREVLCSALSHLSPCLVLYFLLSLCLFSRLS